MERIFSAEDKVYRKLRASKHLEKSDVDSLNQSQIASAATKALISRIKNRKSIDIQLMRKYLEDSCILTTAQEIWNSGTQESRNHIENQLGPLIRDLSRKYVDKMEQGFKPFVGLCGTHSLREASASVALIRETGFNLDGKHVPMMGFQVSYKSLYRGFSESNMRVPHIAALPKMLEVTRPYVFTTLHYFAENDYSIYYDIEKLLDVCGRDHQHLVGGIQFNNVWPNHEHLMRIKEDHPSIAMILPLLPKAVEGKSNEQIVEAIAKHYSFVDYITIDGSGGRGIELNIPYAADLFKSLRSNFGKQVIIFAGGFTAENVKERATRLKVAVGDNNFGIDAEGGLRERVGDKYGEDKLDFRKVKGYLRAASDIFLHQNGSQ